MFNRTQPKHLQFRLFFAVNLFILAPTGIIFAMCILFKLDITLEAVALLGLRSARVVILIWEHIAPSEGVVHTILNILAGYLPYSYSIYFTIERGNTLIPLEVYTYHTYILNILHLGRERVHTHTLRGVHLPYSYTWTRHTFPPRYGRAISYHRIHAQTKFRQTPPARGFSGSHIVRGFLRVFLDHFSEPGSSIWPALALASFHAA